MRIRDPDPENPLNFIPKHKSDLDYFQHRCKVLNSSRRDNLGKLSQKRQRWRRYCTVPKKARRKLRACSRRSSLLSCSNRLLSLSCSSTECSCRQMSTAWALYTSRIRSRRLCRWQRQCVSSTVCVKERTKKSMLIYEKETLLCRSRFKQIFSQNPSLYSSIPGNYSVADPDPDPIVRGKDPDSAQIVRKNLYSYCFVTSFWTFIFEKWCKCSYKKE